MHQLILERLLDKGDQVAAEMVAIDQVYQDYLNQLLNLELLIQVAAEVAMKVQPLSEDQG